MSRVSRGRDAEALVRGTRVRPLDDARDGRAAALLERVGRDAAAREAHDGQRAGRAERRLGTPRVTVATDLGDAHRDADEPPFVAVAGRAPQHDGQCRAAARRPGRCLGLQLPRGEPRAHRRPAP